LLSLTELTPLVRSWIDQDPDSETVNELTSLLSEATAGNTAALAELSDRFSTRLSFGTAGLRGAIAGGPNRMNRVVVMQAAAGLANYLLKQPHDGVPSVVIGYDGRKNSEVFARDSAEVFSGLGVTAHLMPRMLPTPVLAFAVRDMAASAGVMVTASHNPAADNGYKVYLGGEDQGSQIVSPADAHIASEIDSIAATQKVTELTRGEFGIVPETTIENYIARTADIVAGPSTQPRIVYTALHGVGFNTFSDVITRAGFSVPDIVMEQNTPDASFPTVAFPNPEEPGALDMAYALAKKNQADLIVANDPDADRLAVAIPDDTAPNGYRRLTGNELGSILGWWTARNLAASGSHGALACSIVSSPALAAVAKHYGLDFQWTLTGFKWVSRVPGLAFGYEEALGYLVDPEVIRDKDGISAALVLMSIVSDLAADGKTLAEHLDEFSALFGGFVSEQISVRVTDLSAIDKVMSSLRQSPPHEIGGIAVKSVEDLAHGVDGLPPSDVIRFWLEDGSRVMVRPSGTEPKLKVYVDVVSHEDNAEERKRDSSTRLEQLSAGMRKIVAL
jgi:phosphomannomutase